MQSIIFKSSGIMTACSVRNRFVHRTVAAHHGSRRCDGIVFGVVSTGVERAVPVESCSFIVDDIQVVFAGEGLTVVRTGP